MSFFAHLYFLFFVCLSSATCRYRSNDIFTRKMTRKIFAGEKFGKIKTTSEINRLRCQCQQAPQARKKWIFTKIPQFLGPFFTFDPKIFAGHSQLVVVQVVDGMGGA